MEAVELAFVHVGGDDAGTLVDECMGDGASDALSGRGDERDLAFETFCHAWVLLSIQRSRRLPAKPRSSKQL